MLKEWLEQIKSALGTVESLAYLGLAALIGGYFYYNVNSLWDWKAQAAIYGGAALLLLYGVLNFAKIRAAFASRTGRHGTAAGVTLILVIGILAMLNFLNFRHSKRIDLTENQLYALSSQSLKVVENLDAEMQIIGFFQDEATTRSFKDLMEEYRHASSQISYEIVDPQKEPEKVAQHDIQRQGQVVVVAGARKEVIDEFGEEKITNTLIKLTREGEKVVYLLTGHGERDLEESGPEGLSMAKEMVEKQNYVVKSYNLAQENKLPDDATVILSAGPTVNFFPNEVSLLNEYLEKGGKFLLLLDPETDFAMDDFLAAYGLSVEKNVVIDASGVGQLFGLGVAAPIVATYEDHPITEEMRGVMTFFPMARGVKTVEGSLGYESKTLMSTSERSWGETKLDGNRAAFDEGEDTQGPVALAAVATRSVTASETPEGSKDDAEGAADNPAESAGAAETEGEAAEKKGGESRFALFGDSDFATNAYFASSANGDMFRMTVSWLAEDSDLTAIAPKNPENRRINLTQSQSRLMFWATVILLPLSTLVFGLAVWFRRK